MLKKLMVVPEGTHQSEANREGSNRMVMYGILKMGLMLQRLQRDAEGVQSVSAHSKQSCCGGDDIKENHLTDPWDPWLPCGDAANTVGGCSLYFQGWFLYQEAKVFKSLFMFLFIKQKSSPIDSLQRFPLKWHSLFNFTFILLFTSKINIPEFPTGLHKQAAGICIVCVLEGVMVCLCLHPLSALRQFTFW